MRHLLREYAERGTGAATHVARMWGLPSSGPARIIAQGIALRRAWGGSYQLDRARTGPDPGGDVVYDARYLRFTGGDCDDYVQFPLARGGELIQQGEHAHVAAWIRNAREGWIVDWTRGRNVWRVRFEGEASPVAGRVPRERSSMVNVDEWIPSLACIQCMADWRWSRAGVRVGGAGGGGGYGGPGDVSGSAQLTPPRSPPPSLPRVPDLPPYLFGAGVSGGFSVPPAPVGGT